MKTKEQILEGLRQFYGTLAYHGVSSELVLTDGMKYLCESAECFWLADIVASVLIDRRIVSYLQRYSPVIVSIKKNSDGSATVKIGNIYEQEIEYTDFPLESFEFYIGDDGLYFVAMLLGEN